MRDLSLVSRKAHGAMPMSRSQLCSLKDKIDTAGGAPVTIVRSLHAFVNWVRFCFVARPAPIDTACTRTGHVLPTNGWVSGQAPLCGECGEQVVDPLELRSKGEEKQECEAEHPAGANGQGQA